MSSKLAKEKYEKSLQKSDLINRYIDLASQRRDLVRCWRITSLQFPSDIGIDSYFRFNLRARISLKAKELGLYVEE